MLKIGITGGIGSGKSTVCRIFEQLGIPVYSADIRAKELMHEDLVLVSEIQHHFGPDTYDAEGCLQRQFLAALVFHDTEKLALLNSLVHPALFRDYASWANRQEKVPYIVKEAALLFESGSYKDQDYIITVSSPEKVRIDRVMARDHVSAEAVLARMKNQLSEEERLEKADFIIQNDGEHPLIPQVLNLHKELVSERGKDNI